MAGSSTGHSERLVARNFLALGSGEAVARVVAFAATIYIARVLGAELYGLIGFATAILLYLNRIADGGLELGLGVREIAARPEELEGLVSSLLTFRILVGAATAVLLAAVALLVAPGLEGTVLALYGLTLLAVGGSTRWVHLGLEKSRRVAIARALGELLVVAIVLALVRGPSDVVRVPLAQFAGDSLAAILLLWWLHRQGFRFRIAIDWDHIRPLFRRASWLVLSALLGLMIYNSDLIFLRFFRDLAAVGYYAAAYTLIGFLVNLGIAYGLSLLPTLTRLSARPAERRSLYRTAMVHMFAAGFPIAVGGSLLARKIIDLVFGSGYAASGIVLAVLIWALPVSLFREVGTAALMSNGREDRVLRITGWATGLNLTLNILLIPPFGLIGAAVASIVTEAVRLLMTLYHAHVEGFTLTGLERYWRPLVAASAMAAVLLAIRPLAVWLAIPLGATIYVVGLTVLGGLRFRSGLVPVLRL